MFFLQFEVTPRRSRVESDDVAGAFVNCWIEAPTLDDAVARAKATIEREGWIVDEVEEAREVDRSAYEREPAGLPYYEQALVDKEVYVFHMYPADENESGS